MSSQTKAAPTTKLTETASFTIPTMVSTVKSKRLSRIIKTLVFASLAITTSVDGVYATTSPIHHATTAANIPPPSIIPDAEEVVPNSLHRKISRDVFQALNRQHFNKIAMDDTTSNAVFNQYIDTLDPLRYYFLAEDIQAFDAFRTIFDDAIKTGNLKPGFHIYNVYQKRVVERLVHMNHMIDTLTPEMTFTLEESLETDREKAKWALSKSELNELWRLRLKSAVLTMKLSNEKSLAEIQQTLKKRYQSKLNRQLQTKVTTRTEDAFQTYINSYAHIYDPHTQYLSPRTSENFRINMSLSLEGIGAVLQSEDEFTKIVRLVPGGPADKSKLLKPGDKIVGVGQGKTKSVTDVMGWRIDEVVDLIRGPAHSHVSLEILSSTSDTQFDTNVIQIKRDKVKLTDQEAKSNILELKQDKQLFKIGTIKIPTFYSDFNAYKNRDDNYKSTTRDVEKLLTALEKKGIDGLVIDLRDNGGGSLQEANKLLGLFIHSGPTVQVKDQRKIRVYKDDDKRIRYQGPLAVIVNRMSASASEIFAGAIQDYQRGIIIGSQTFGKGTVQALLTLQTGKKYKNPPQLKFTESKFYRISGESNQHQGIIPDINYPKVYNHKEIGESALDNALPWDTIAPITHQQYFEIQPTLATLKARHLKRTDTNPSFQYLTRRLQLLDAWNDITVVSLNEKTRRLEKASREKQLLDLLNSKRKALKQTPLKELPDDELAVTNMEKDNDAKEDAYLQEAGAVLIDFMTVSQLSTKEPQEKAASKGKNR